jgi:hypothetical protein
LEIVRKIMVFTTANITHSPWIRPTGRRIDRATWEKKRGPLGKMVSFRILPYQPQ